MLLCNMNQTVITASADRTIRAWQPHSSEQCASPTMVGRHRDYVRCLAWARNPGLLFSGALDRSIAIWDINVGQPDHPIVSLQLNKNDDYDGVGAGVDRGSVYALGVGEYHPRRRSRPLMHRPCRLCPGGWYTRTGRSAVGSARWRREYRQACWTFGLRTKYHCKRGWQICKCRLRSTTSGLMTRSSPAARTPQSSSLS